MKPKTKHFCIVLAVILSSCSKDDVSNLQPSLKESVNAASAATAGTTNIFSGVKFYSLYSQLSSDMETPNGAVRIKPDVVYTKVSNISSSDISKLTANLELLPGTDDYDRNGAIYIVMGSNTPTSSSTAMEVGRFITPFAKKDATWAVGTRGTVTITHTSTSPDNKFTLHNSYGDPATTDIVNLTGNDQLVAAGNDAFKLAKKKYSFDLSYLLPMLDGQTFWVGLCMSGARDGVTFMGNLSLTTVAGGTRPNTKIKYIGSAEQKNGNSNFNFSKSVNLASSYANPKLLVYANSFGADANGEEYLYRTYDVKIDGTSKGSFNSKQNAVGYLPYNPSTGAYAFFTTTGSELRNWVPAAPCILRTVSLGSSLASGDHSFSLIPANAPTPSGGNRHLYSVFLVGS